MEHPNQYFQGPRYPFRPWRPPRLGRPLFKNASSPNWRMDGPCYPAPYPDFRFYSNHPPNFWQAPRRFPFQNSGWTHPRPLTPLMQCTPWDIHSTPFQPPNDLSTIQRLPKSAEDKAYSAFLKATKLTSQSVHTLSQNDILNKQVFEILKIMCDYKDTVNNFQFLIRLLRQQEFYPEGEPSKRVKLIMVFVRLVRGLKLVQKLKSDTISVKSKGEIDRIIKYFTDVFNKTLEQVKSQKLCSVAATHLKILQSVKIECSEIGLNIRPFGDADKGLEDLQKQKRTSREIIRTPDNSVLLQDEPEKYEKTPDDSTIDSPIPVWEPVYQPVNDEEMSLWESDQTLLDQIKKTKSAPICANPSTRKISKPAHNFDEEQLKLIQQFVESRNELLQQDSSKKSEKCSKYVKTIHQLVSVFIKSRRIGLGHKDSEYLQVLLQDEVALTNTGRKACLWALCLILENTDSPPNLSFTDAENLDCLIGNMDIQRQ
ncbi:uncharacterized protein LOC110847667 isoform X2 [Folsomia candida]|uniref:uncharacterized protein LOC110847667 isoform X2 n=1 Tax=Folsomia candida TaxID=158441 RepID=UPI001604D869|nr:uncharacterized protein LOC110847667 isoform X2 [Folsomia candida]